MLCIYAEPEVEHGVDRGGEDLYIAFSTRTDERPNLNNPIFSVDISGERHRGINVDILKSENEVTITRIRWSTSYEFEWEGGKRELELLVAEALKDEKNWSRPGINGTIYEFRWRKFIGGNAD